MVLRGNKKGKNEEHEQKMKINREKKKRGEDYKRRVRSRFTWSAGSVEGERGSGVEPP